MQEKIFHLSCQKVRPYLVSANSVPGKVPITGSNKGRMTYRLRIHYVILLTQSVLIYIACNRCINIRQK